MLLSQPCRMIGAAGDPQFWEDHVGEIPLAQRTPFGPQIPRARPPCCAPAGAVLNFARLKLQGDNKMGKEFSLLAAIAAVFALLTFGAQAMPAAPLKGIAKSNPVIQTSGGCGHWRHRGPHGHCRSGP